MKDIQTLKAFANRRTLSGLNACLVCIPGFEHSENPGSAIEEDIQTLKAFANRRTLSGFN